MTRTCFSSTTMLTTTARALNEPVYPLTLLTCSICQLLCYKPLQHLPCNNIFCSSCLIRWQLIHKNASCPTCRSVLQYHLVHPANALIDQLSQIPMQCIECEYIDSYEKMIIHHDKETLYLCPNQCNRYYHGNELALHISTNCPSNPSLLYYKNILPNEQLSASNLAYELSCQKSNDFNQLYQIEQTIQPISNYQMILHSLNFASKWIDSLANQLVPVNSKIMIIHSNSKRELCKVIKQEHLTVLVYSKLYGTTIQVQLMPRNLLPFEPYIDFNITPEIEPRYLNHSSLTSNTSSPIFQPRTSSPPRTIRVIEVS